VHVLDVPFAMRGVATATGARSTGHAQVVARRIQSMKEMIGDDVETLREIEALLR
jgi:hypothetical protein